MNKKDQQPLIYFLSQILKIFKNQKLDTKNTNLETINLMIGDFSKGRLKWEVVLKDKQHMGNFKMI